MFLGTFCHDCSIISILDSKLASSTACHLTPKCASPLLFLVSEISETLEIKHGKHKTYKNVVEKEHSLLKLWF